MPHFNVKAYALFAYNSLWIRLLLIGCQWSYENRFFFSPRFMGRGVTVIPCTFHGQICQLVGNQGMNLPWETWPKPRKNFALHLMNPRDSTDRIYGSARPVKHRQWTRKYMQGGTTWDAGGLGPSQIVPLTLNPSISIVGGTSGRHLAPREMN